MRIALLAGVAVIALTPGIVVSNAQQPGRTGAERSNSTMGTSSSSMPAAPGGQTKGRSPSASSNTKNEIGRSAAEGQNQSNDSTVGDGGTQPRSSENRSDRTNPPGQNRSSAASEQNGHDGSASADDRDKENRSAQSQSNDRSERNGGNTQERSNTSTAEGDRSTGNRNTPQTGRSAVSSQGGKNDAGATNITTEERGRIRSEVAHVNIKEASNIDVHVNIGAEVPRTITEYWVPVPREIVEIVPAWRPYRVVRIRNDILIIDPDSFKIVYVIES